MRDLTRYELKIVERIAQETGRSQEEIFGDAVLRASGARSLKFLDMLRAIERETGAYRRHRVAPGAVTAEYGTNDLWVYHKGKDAPKPRSHHSRNNPKLRGGRRRR